MVCGERLTRRAVEADIAELAFLSDRHGAALVDEAGTVAWLCLPRVDAGTLCAALLDARAGGHISVAPADEGARCERRYRAASLVLETVWHTSTGSARVTDCLVIDPDCPKQPAATLLRVCDGLAGEVTFSVDVEPRCDYGAAAVWVRKVGTDAFSMTAGNDGLLVWTDGGPARTGAHRVAGPVRVGAGDRWRLAVRYVEPAAFDDGPGPEVDADAVDRMLDRTCSYWDRALDGLELDGELEAAGVRESVVVLHGLTNARSGAVAAAATTSLPESDRGRTWDYRATWVRDAVFAARSLGELGHGALADGFHRFILRTAAGDAEGVRILYGMGGERRRPELEIEELRGWRGIGPVRVGNDAAGQEQHDVLGELLGLAWRRHLRGTDPDADDWRFLRAVADHAAGVWERPDRGIWEWRGEPRHFVHSKALCWAALDHALCLAESCGFDAPEARWREAREAIGEAVDRRGVDGRGVFVQVFDGEDLDAAALLLPVAGYCAWDDPRMVATADALRDELDDGGLLRRYRADDGQPGEEHPFTPCTFWLAECLARQGRQAEATRAFSAAMAVRTPLGLFSEEADPLSGRSWGNVPQALSHLSHIAAAIALDRGG